MLNLKITNVDLTAQTMIGGIKTAAGKNRLVPIHSKIYAIVKSHFVASMTGYLFEYKGMPIKSKKYREFFFDVMDTVVGVRHTPHECRHTFRSRLDSAGANKVCIDRMMGHKSKEVGERIYTHKSIEELKLNIELITN